MYEVCGNWDWEASIATAVARCLGVLEFCGSLDPVAARFHGQLSWIQLMLDNPWSHKNSSGTTDGNINLPEAVLPLTSSCDGKGLPPGANPGPSLSHTKIGAALLSMLEIPFSDRSTCTSLDSNLSGRSPQWEHTTAPGSTA
ncbi:hypothetical protein PG989_001969 [Apiospora arundinis]